MKTDPLPLPFAAVPLECMWPLEDILRRAQSGFTYLRSRSGIYYPSLLRIFGPAEWREHNFIITRGNIQLENQSSVTLLQGPLSTSKTCHSLSPPSTIPFHCSWNCWTSFIVLLQLVTFPASNLFSKYTSSTIYKFGARRRAQPALGSQNKWKMMKADGACTFVDCAEQ